MLKELNIEDSKQIVFAGGFNSFFDVGLEAIGEKPRLKHKTVSKLLEIKSFHDLHDIWRFRNTMKNLTLPDKNLFQASYSASLTRFLHQTVLKGLLKKLAF